VPLRRRSRDPEQQRRAEQSLRALEAGGIPLAASERLEEFRRRGDRFFTSALTVNEVALSGEAGFRPLTQVMGSCFYNTGWQAYPWVGAGGGAPGFGSPTGDGQTFELEQQTGAWNEARRLALDRLSEEAHRAEADAVVGVRLLRRHHDWAAGLIEFVVVGTAVRSERYDLGGETVISNLSGQDFSKLFRHGFWPAGLVAGSTVAYVASGWAQQQSSRGWGSGRLRNQEMPDYTRGIYDARALAMEHVTRQAHAVHAHGVVGVAIERSQRELERSGNSGYTDLIIEMHVLGTAVIELERSQEPPGTYLDLQLNDQEAT
jgi:uncharacterized protein YbjQ (UPF0145 family)